MDLSQRLLVAEAEVQFRGDGDGQEAVDSTMIPRSFYPGNLFADKGPLEKFMVRPSVVAGQDWANVVRTKSTIRSVETILQNLNAHGVTFIIPKEDQRPWSPPRGYQCVYESYFQNDSRLWFPIARIVTSYAFRRGVALSQLINGSIRLMVALSVIAAEADTSLSVRAFEELTSVSISEDGIVSTRQQPNYNVLLSNRSAFEEPLSSKYRVLWNADMAVHPNVDTYSEDWKQRAQAVPLQKQDHWDNFTRERISRSIHVIADQYWISNSVPYIKNPANRRLSLLTPDEQKEVNRARRMKELPDLSRIVAARVGTKRKVAGSGTEPSGSINATVAPVVVEQNSPGETPRKKSSGKKKAKRTASPEEDVEKVVPNRDDRPSRKKKEKKKKRKGDPSPDEVPLKKKRRKSSEVLRPSSVCEEELRALESENQPVNRGSEDDDDQTVAARARELKRRAAGEGSSGVPENVQDVVGVSGASPKSRERSSPFLDKSPSPIQEGSETSASGCRGDVSSDKFNFEFNRELPLPFYPEECGRLMLKFKGGPGQMPPADELIFKDEYEHAASSSVKEKAELEAKRAAEALRHSEEMGRLRKSQKYEVTHERIRVMIAMIRKAEKRFHRLSLREKDRDKYDDARCLHSQAFGTRKCLEQIRDSAVEIPQEKIDEFSESNEGLIDSEAAIALQTPLRDPTPPPPREPDANLVLTAGSSTRRDDLGTEPVQPAPVDENAPKDGGAPTIVLSDSPAKTSKALSSSSSTSEDPEAEDGALKEKSAANVNSPVSAFGHVSGPEGGGNEDPPAADE
ncbi:hypothetical protein Bca4012_026675 [Brassica carinata]